MVASETRPPELPRRSSRIPAPAGARRTALRTASPEPFVNAATLIITAPPRSRVTVTESVERRARRRVSVHARVPRFRPRVTGVFARVPRSRDTTSVTGRPVTSLPSMAVSLSPSWMPARSAGPPRCTRDTSILPSASRRAHRPTPV